MRQPIDYGNANITIIDPDDTDPQQTRTDADEKTDAILDALKEDNAAYLNVTRQTMGGNSPQQFVGRFPADKFDFGQLQAHLQQNFGGGDYRVMLYAKGRVRANKLLSIADAIIKRPETGVAGEVGVLLNQVMQQMDRMNQQIVTILQDKNTGSQSRMEMMQEMMMMKQLFSGGEKSNGLGQLTEAIEVMKTLGVNIGGQSEDSGGGFGNLLNLAAPLLQKAMEAPQPAPVYQQNPAPVLTRQPPVNNQPQPPQADPRKKEMNLMIRVGINQLVAAAKRDGDHHEYAVMVLDNIPEETAKGFFSDPTGMAKLIQIQPEVGNHLIWFETVGEHVKALLGLPCRPEISELYDEDELTDENQPDIVEESQSPVNSDNGKNKLHNAGDS